MQKIILTVFRGLWELATNNATTILIWLGGTGLMFYVASITEWLRVIGPFGWTVAAVAAMLVVSISFATWSWGLGRYGSYSLAKERMKTATTNVLAPAHNHERLNVSEFYSPFYIPTEHVNFTDCHLYGPAAAAILGGSFINCVFRECEIVIVREDRAITGAVPFHDCNFLRSKLIRVTMLMNFRMYMNLPESMRRTIPVISDGRVGDV